MFWTTFWHFLSPLSFDSSTLQDNFDAACVQSPDFWLVTTLRVNPECIVVPRSRLLQANCSLYCSSLLILWVINLPTSAQTLRADSPLRPSVLDAKLTIDGSDYLRDSQPEQLLTSIGQIEMLSLQHTTWQKVPSVLDSGFKRTLCVALPMICTLLQACHLFVSPHCIS